MAFLKQIRALGPGILVTAAFIGPGTLTTCTIAGANFGFALLWGLLFSVLATIALQEMTARLGVIGQVGLGQAIRQQFTSGWLRIISVLLIISAIVIGNAAYETGNILGASLGIQYISGISKIKLAGLEIQLWGLIIGIIAFLILLSGNYKAIEKILITLVVIMSISFLTTSILIGPQLTEILKGLIIPRLPKGSSLMLIGLIGTTVVPYNLFLHASVVQEGWKSNKDLKIARLDLIISIILGGIVSMSILVSSAAAFYGTNTEIKGASDLAIQLKPLLGDWAGIFMATGLFAAGISSAITAPLAAAYATSGILNFDKNLRSLKFRSIWIAIILIGTIFSTVGFKPIKAIIFAQITNGILLPIIGVFLLLIMNNNKLLGKYRNSLPQNIIGIIVIFIMLILGLKSILAAIGLL